MITYNYPGWTWWLKSNQFPTVSKWDIRWIKSSPVHHLLSNHLKPPMSCFFCSKKLAWCENYFLKSYQRGQLAEWCTVYETRVVKKKFHQFSITASKQLITSLNDHCKDVVNEKKKKKKGPTQHNILHQEVQQPLQQQPSISKETKMETPRVKRGNFPTIHPFSIHPLVLSIVSRG